MPTRSRGLRVGKAAFLAGFLGTFLGTFLAASVEAQQAPRARDLGVDFDGTTGPLNAITDVVGVEVGHTTLIAGEGPLVVGEGPARTGVTAILPRGRGSYDPVFAAWFPLNGNGEMTGTTWVDESGLLTSPVLITNTHSVGMVHHATLGWMVENQPGFLWALPVVAETWDGVLNDINGFHVGPEHAVAALDGARGGPVEEGAVGGGTGMICHGFKGGIGTSSRVLPESEGGHTVGVLVQCNYGRPRALRIAGVPVGETLREEGFQVRCRATTRPPTRDWLRNLPPCDSDGASPADDAELGSIIIIVATDAPLLPHQLERVVKRATLGLGRVGSIAGNGSGDIFLAFSTAGPDDGGAGDAVAPGAEPVPNDRLDPLFEATVDATEEAIINALVAARTMTGADDVRVRALPHDRLREILARHGRLIDPAATTPATTRPATDTSAPHPTAAAPDSLDRYIAREMDARRIPGLALAVVRNGEMVDERAYGLASVENDVPVTPATRFALASLTKQFTAVGILMLVEEGRLDLDTSILRYLPDDAPRAWEPVTPRHLLTHTSGLPPIGQGFRGHESVYNRVWISAHDAWTAARADTLHSDPGERFAYSDVAFFLLGVITERVSGRSWRDFMRERIFEPLGMTDTFIIDPIGVHPRLARGYTLRDDALTNLHRPWQFELASHFGIFSNVRDLARWDAALYDDRLIGDASRREMWTPVRLNDGSTHPYGLGWEVHEIGGRTILRHTGITGTEIVRVPDEGLTVIVLTNLGRGFGGTADSWGIARAIAMMMVPERTQ